MTSTAVPQLQFDALLDALDAASHRPTLMVDLKGPGQVGRRGAETVHDRRPDQPILVCSRWWPSAMAFERAHWARPVLSARNRAELDEAEILRTVRGG